MSDVNVAGLPTAVGEMPEDYAAFERHMQPSKAAAQETPAEPAAETGGEESESDGDTQESPKDQDQDESEDAADEKPKKKGGWQRAREKAERENAELRARLEKLEGTLAGNPAKADPKTDEQPKTFSGKPEPKAESFDSYEAYTKELVRWQNAELRAEEAQTTRQANAQNAQAEAVKAFHDRAAEVAKLPGFEDFHDVIEDADIDVSPAVNACMIESEQGPKIGYYLAKHPAELERLNALSPLAAAREMGKLEARFAKTASPKPLPVSATPDPITPTGGGRTRAVLVAKIDDPNISFADFEKQANQKFRR